MGRCAAINTGEYRTHEPTNRSWPGFSVAFRESCPPMPHVTEPSASGEVRAKLLDASSRSRGAQAPKGGVVGRVRGEDRVMRRSVTTGALAGLRSARMLDGAL